MADFWSGRRVLLTGHTGFKGAWTARWLHRRGAVVSAVGLPPEPGPNMFNLLQPTMGIQSNILDIRDGAALREVVRKCDPHVVIHMAAQALLPRSYRIPVETWSTNVVGTVTLLDALRDRPSLRAVVIVTSDKVYENAGLARPFVEGDTLGGDDPYSASKAATELAVASWRRSFARNGPPIVTARSGNVIGGGDWSADRLIPDLMRAIEANQPVALRNPHATRPWQHVLEPVAGYLLLAERLALGDNLPAALNFGPPPEEVRTTRELIERAFRSLNRSAHWRHVPDPAVPEQRTLTLDAALAQRTLGWKPRLHIDDAIDWTMEWYAAYGRGADIAAVTDTQIARYEAC